MCYELFSLGIIGLRRTSAHLLFISMCCFPAIGICGEKPSAEDLRICRRATETLRNLSSKLSKENSLMYLFVETHYNISSHLYEALSRGEFENPSYVARFNAEFVNMLPFGKSNIPSYWSEALNMCKDDGKYFGIERCANNMASAHIEGDMPEIFAKLGCGNSDDWVKIFALAIKPGLDEAIEYVKAKKELYGHVWKEFLATASTWYAKYKRTIQREQADCN